MSVTLALDVGEKRIGVACSDPLGIAALPLDAIARTSLEADLSAVCALAEARGAEAVVVGLPKTLRNEIGQQARKVLAFARALEKRVPCRVETWDERLTTAEASRAFQGVSPKKRRRQREKRRPRQRGGGAHPARLSGEPIQRRVKVALGLGGTPNRDRRMSVLPVKDAFDKRLHVW